ncbi:MAG TPA: SDR family oxidoreductase [Dehalococcoidia bacterium]|nr:SDR family oxidoreductase [Dehalococcoidia bacterium]
MSDKWALILGASSGFGAATSIELARAGFGIFGVHFDLRATLPNAVHVQDEVTAAGQEAVFFNINAADAGKRAQALDQVRQKLGPDGHVRVLMHSLAFGTLLPFIEDNPKERISQKQMDMTLDVMAHSLVYWAQDMAARRLLGRNSRIFAMTSSGSTRVIKSYGAVSAAKAALESHIRQLAFELAPLGVTANAVRAGVTDTPALRRIPGGPELHARAMASNPSGRSTTPEDVAKAIAALTDERLYWMTGNVLGVDGGEDLTA